MIKEKCSIIPSSALFQDLFNINASTGSITVQGPLDRETVSRITLSIQAEDISGLQTQITTCERELYAYARTSVHISFIS